MLRVAVLVFAFGSFSWWWLGNRLGSFGAVIAGQLVAWALGGVLGICLAEDARGWRPLSDRGALLVLAFLAVGGDLLLLFGPVGFDRAWLLLAVGSFISAHLLARSFRRRVSAVEREKMLSSTLEVTEAVVWYGVGGLSAGLGLVFALLAYLVAGWLGPGLWLWLVVAAGLAGVAAGVFLVGPRIVTWYRRFFRRKWGL